MNKCKIEENHACCYTSNHGKDEFICTVYNKGCEFYDKCNEIYELDYIKTLKIYELIPKLVEKN